MAEAANRELVRLEQGKTREETVKLLIAEADRNSDLIVGFDFAFSLPEWYLRDRALTPRALWAMVANEALTPRMSWPSTVAKLNGATLLDHDSDTRTASR